MGLRVGSLRGRGDQDGRLRCAHGQSSCTSRARGSRRHCSRGFVSLAWMAIGGGVVYVVDVTHEGTTGGGLVGGWVGDHHTGLCVRSVDACVHYISPDHFQLIKHKFKILTVNFIVNEPLARVEFASGLSIDDKLHKHPYISLLPSFSLKLHQREKTKTYHITSLNRTRRARRICAQVLR